MLLFSALDIDFDFDVDVYFGVYYDLTFFHFLPWFFYFFFVLKPRVYFFYMFVFYSYKYNNCASRPKEIFFSRNRGETTSGFYLLTRIEPKFIRHYTTSFIKKTGKISWIIPDCRLAESFFEGGPNPSINNTHPERSKRGLEAVTTFLLSCLKL